MKKHVFTYGVYTYRYSLLRQERKTVSLTVRPDLSIVLKCPLGYPTSKIDAFLKRKWHWMEKQLQELRRYRRLEKSKEYVSGESFLYLGRQYKLVVRNGDADAVKLERGRMLVSTKRIHQSGKRIKTMLDVWYAKRAEQVFNERYKEVMKKFTYDFTPVFIIQKMDKRWGSFSAHKRILLNPELIKASKECIDYVITHELCHMMHQHHSKAFYRMLHSKFPNWEKTKDKMELRLM